MERGGGDSKTRSLSAAADRRGLQLIVLAGEKAQVHVLPGGGRLVIGRGSESDVCIDSASISRRHALLHIGGAIQVEDLGSSNGTQVRGRRLAAGERAELRPGDVLELGDTVCVLRGPASGDKQLGGHVAFVSRLEAECAHAARAGGTFTVARVRVSRPRAELETSLAADLPDGDLAARYGKDEYELLVLGATPEEQDAKLAALRKRLEKLAGGVTTGVAAFPRAGRTADALLGAANDALVAEPAAGAAAGEPIVVDAVMVQLHRALERIAAGTINVLLLGETGAGKEVLAGRIHALSRRAAGPFLPLNCGAFTESLLESELFGHEKGAFSGATQAKAGLLETADGGTVFLDEVGELPPSLQVKLLRVLEDQKIRRVGSVKTTAINIRIVSATNRDLDAEVAAGRFRADLYYRLNGFALVIPPLRARPAEIEPLARRFVAAASRQEGRAPPTIHDDVLAVLRGHHWPGNVRELRNVMERAVLLADAEILPEHLPLERMGGVPVKPGADADPERARVVQALAQAVGNQSRAAELLGVSRSTLVAKIAKYGIPRPRGKR